MKSNRFSLLNLALFAVGFTSMGMAEETGVGATAEEAKPAKTPAAPLEIIRGRMPCGVS